MHRNNPNVHRNGDRDIEGEGDDRDELLGGEYRDDGDNGVIQRLPTDISNPDLIMYDYDPNQRS